MGRRETYTLAKISGGLGGADMLGWSEHGREERPVGETLGEHGAAQLRAVETVLCRDHPKTA